MAIAEEGTAEVVDAVSLTLLLNSFLRTALYLVWHCPMTSFADSPSFLQVVDVEEAVVVAAAAEHALQLRVG